jgi:putative endonuclease
MHFVYILYSLKDHKLYKGYTSNIQNRLAKHNSGGSKSNSHRRPFVLIHIEQFENKTDALVREKYLKTLEGGSELKTQLVQKGVLNSEGKLDMK